MKKLLIALTILFAANSYAAVDKDLLIRVQEYLNESRNIKGDFVQQSSNSKKDSGEFYISRPSLIRLDYKSPQQMVSDGKNLIYYDKKLDQVTHIGLNSIPAGILFKKDLDLLDGKEIKVIQTQQVDEYYEILATLAKDPAVGNIKIYFRKAPFELVGWETKDATGLTTRVTLQNIEKTKSFSKDFFTIKRQKIYTSDGVKDANADFY